MFGVTQKFRLCERSKNSQWSKNTISKIKLHLQYVPISDLCEMFGKFQIAHVIDILLIRSGLAILGNTGPSSTFTVLASRARVVLQNFESVFPSVALAPCK